MANTARSKAALGKSPASAKRAAVRRSAVGQALKDPAGGLTAAGRRHFAEADGAHLRPGVTGPADTPQKRVRKGSFLRRHFANPQGPMVDAKGGPTRLALSAHAWGEPVPHTLSDAKKLAAKGKQLLADYHAERDKAQPAKAQPAKARPAKARPAKAATQSKRTGRAAK